MIPDRIMQQFRALAGASLDQQFLRYLMASAVALMADMGSFLVLLETAALPAGLSAAIAYAVGIVVHWLLSSRAVFHADLADRGHERTRQKALFVGSALLGMGLTSAIVSAVAALGGDARIGKIIAIGASFTATWLLRKNVVFRSRLNTAG